MKDVSSRTTTKGEIKFLPNAEFFPRFFVGVAPNIATTWPGDEAFQPGQFLFRHQYAGHSCSSILLFGIELPIVSGKDARIVDQLRGFADHYGEYVYQGDYAEAQRMLSGIGPMELRSSGRDDVEEAFFRFKNTDSAYEWILKQGFEYIDAFREKTEEQRDADWAGACKAIAAIPDLLVEKEIRRLYPVPPWTKEYVDQMLTNGAGRRVVERRAVYRFYREHLSREQELFSHTFHTRQLQWRSARDIASWLEGPFQREISSEDLFVALLYENSD